MIVVWTKDWSDVLFALFSKDLGVRLREKSLFLLAGFPCFSPKTQEGQGYSISFLIATNHEIRAFRLRTFMHTYSYALLIAFQQYWFVGPHILIAIDSASKLLQKLTNAGPLLGNHAFRWHIGSQEKPTEIDRTSIREQPRSGSQPATY